MEDKEKTYRKLKLGLALKKVMLDTNNSGTNDLTDDKTSTSFSFRQLESLSGIRHASIVQIVNGKKNASWSTIDAILEGLGMTLTQFAIVYDEITEKEISEYQREIEKRKQERVYRKKS